MKPIDELDPELQATLRTAFPKTRNPGGRPKSAHPKQQITLRLDPDILEFYRADGPGWQVRMAEILREAMKRGS